MIQTDRIKLKEMVLQAVLNKEALPGSSQPLMFPDLPLLFSQPGIYLVDEDIKETRFITTNKPIRMVSEKFLEEEAGKVGQVYFLQVRANEKAKDKAGVSVTVELKVRASVDAGSYVLSNMQLDMERQEGGWMVIGNVSSMSA